MPAPAVRIIHLSETRARLNRFSDDLEDLKDAHDSLGREIADDARGRIRVATGAARATMRAVPTPGAAIVQAGGGGVDYAMVLDRRDGFLRTPANDQTRARDRIDDGITDLIRHHNLS